MQQCKIGHLARLFQDSPAGIAVKQLRNGFWLTPPLCPFKFRSNKQKVFTSPSGGADVAPSLSIESDFRGRLEGEGSCLSVCQQQVNIMNSIPLLRFSLAYSGCQ